MPGQDQALDHIAAFRRLYPNLDEAELQEAVENLDRSRSTIVRPGNAPVAEGSGLTLECAKIHR
jgi:hypothetical protein